MTCNRCFLHLCMLTYIFYHYVCRSIPTHADECMGHCRGCGGVEVASVMLDVTLSFILHVPQSRSSPRNSFLSLSVSHSPSLAVSLDMRLTLVLCLGGTKLTAPATSLSLKSLARSLFARTHTNVAECGYKCSAYLHTHTHTALAMSLSNIHIHTYTYIQIPRLRSPSAT